MDEGRRVTLTVKSIDNREPWHKPNSTQHWYTIVSEDNPGEPTKFIGDLSRDVKAPEIGKSYLGKQFGNKFYPARVVNEDSNSVTKSTEDYQDKPSGEYWDEKNAAIRAQWAIAQAVQIVIGTGNSEGIFSEDKIESFAKELYAMVDRVKGGSESPNPKAQVTQ